MCVRASVRQFVAFYKKLLISFTFHDISTKFGDNVYAYKNMPASNFGLILKKKMATKGFFRFSFLISPYHLPLALFIATVLNFSG